MRSLFSASFAGIYGLHDDQARGRLISLGSALMTAVYNVFVTGIFYTGFLSMYGMSITSVGVISFIPYIANCFSLFSPMVLRRFRRRKRALLCAKVFYYALYILATTLMPSFVTGARARLVCFAAILFVAHAVYALFSPGITTWFYAFYPQENEARNRYIALNQIFSSFMSSAVLLLSGVLADAVSGSAHQGALILAFRYAAFLLVLLDVGMQACAREYPAAESAALRLRDVFTLPFRYRKFLLCMLLMFCWSLNSGLNSGLWSYHLLNHMHFSYTLINAMSVMYTVILILAAPFWRRRLRRYSWIKTFGAANLLWVPTEVLFFLMTKRSAWLYIPLCTVQNFLNVGFNLSYANVLYMNLPEENATAHISFNCIGCNLFTFLGMLAGTAISNLSGDNVMSVWGLPVYSVQFTTLARAVLMALMGAVCVKYWRAFTKDADIADVEAAESIRKAAASKKISK